MVYNIYMDIVRHYISDRATLSIYKYVPTFLFYIQSKQVIQLDRHCIDNFIHPMHWTKMDSLFWLLHSIIKGYFGIFFFCDFIHDILSRSMHQADA